MSNESNQKSWRFGREASEPPGQIEGIVYGPVESRRFGRSLGVNFSAHHFKSCSFDCPYCDLGRTESRLKQLKDRSEFPTLSDLKAAISESLREIHTNGPTIDTICISGNGEPTLHPEFSEAVAALIEARDLWLPGKKIGLLTNGAHLTTRKIIEAVNRLDERVVKIDAGNERVFSLINSPISRTTLSKVLSGLRGLKDLTVQSLFVQGEIDNTKPADVDDWIEVIAVLRPKAVQIHGLSRASAAAGLMRCEEDTLYAIAARLERRTGIKALVTP